MLAAAVAVVFAAACNSAKDTAAPGGDTGNPYVDCLAKNGVSMPAGGGSGGPRGSGMPSGMRPSGMRPSGDFPRPSGSFSPGGPGGGGFGDRGPQGVDASAWARANQACASLRPSGDQFGNRGGNRDDGSAAYRNCLSEHGVTQGGGQLNSTDPQVAAAMATCAPLRPTGQPPAPSAS
jgi:hypothetical protein